MVSFLLWRREQRKLDTDMLSFLCICSGYLVPGFRIVEKLGIFKVVVPRS